jgi:GDPmannose 4,6-dehydratase
VQHSVRDFCYYAFKHVGIELEFVGEGADEKGVVKRIETQSVAAANTQLAVGDVLIEVSPDFFRPTDVVNLWGDPSKAREKLGWNPQKTTFEQLVKIMVDADMAKVAVERASEHITTNLVEYLEKGIVK